MDLITSELPLAEINDGLAQQICRKWGLKSGVNIIRKGFTPSDFEFKEGESATIDYISTKMRDRDGDVVEPSGAILHDYVKNPVVLWCHKYDTLPIGKCEWVKSNEFGLAAKTIYAVNSNPLAKQIYQYRKDGFPLAKSIGFVPLEMKPKKGVRNYHTKFLVLEYSDVPVPANPDALNIAMAKGLLPKPKPKKQFYYRMDEELIVDGRPIEDDMVNYAYR